MNKRTLANQLTDLQERMHGDGWVINRGHPNFPNVCGLSLQYKGDVVHENIASVVVQMEDNSVARDSLAANLYFMQLVRNNLQLIIDALEGKEEFDYFAAREWCHTDIKQLWQVLSRRMNTFEEAEDWGEFVVRDKPYDSFVLVRKKENV